MFDNKKINKTLNSPRNRSLERGLYGTQRLGKVKLCVWGWFGVGLGLADA